MDGGWITQPFSEYTSGSVAVPDNDQSAVLRLCPDRMIGEDTKDIHDAIFPVYWTVSIEDGWLIYEPAALGKHYTRANRLLDLAILP